jgi:L-amino acid N-acyltransferase
LIRFASIEDIPAITAIYNHAISHTIATFDTEPKSVAEREQWLMDHGEKYPVLVMTIEGKVIGWASLSKWSPRTAYDLSAEISLYFLPEFQGKGYGNLLMPAIINAGKQAKLHTIIARISAGNEVSIHLHQKFGFSMVGTLKQVGSKFNCFIDVVMMQLML